MNTEDKMTKLVGQVLRATYDGDVAWRLESPPHSLTRATDNFIPVYLEARYKGVKVVLFEKREKYWTDVDSFSWTSALHFGIPVGDTVVSDYSEFSPMLRQLFEAARDSASNLDSLLDDLLE